LLALTDPSLQMKVLPWQYDMPPFRPLHGEFAATSEVKPKDNITLIAQINVRDIDLKNMRGKGSCPAI
jgi:hypothetical protein